jgi:uncharacterized paraquat-inducible protein A
MNCPHCNYTVSLSAGVCVRCGTSLTQKPKENP